MKVDHFTTILSPTKKSGPYFPTHCSEYSNKLISKFSKIADLKKKILSDLKNDQKWE